MKAINKNLFKIRSLEDRDLTAILALAAPLCSPAFHWPPEKLRQQLWEAGARTYVAEDSHEPSKILGFVCFVDLGYVVEVPVLATLSETQHQGVMRELFKDVIATHYSAQEIWLEVHEGNLKARNLYRTLGFVESGRRPKYYQDGSAAILCNRIPAES